MATRILVPAGVLGLGFEEQALDRGIESEPDIICIDGGSTDSGPTYLGSGQSKYSRTSTKSEWRRLMKARQKAGVPLVIGSAGTCGTDLMVDWMVAITREIAAETGQRLRVATIKSSQSQATVIRAMQNGRLAPLFNAPEISPEAVRRCSNIVALAGAEQIGSAIKTDAEIIIAGRSTDAAVIAAAAILRGEHCGAAWHAGKIAECGALCTTNPMSGVVLVDIDQDGFGVQPMSRSAQCTPRTVSAHMLYENANPFRLKEPGGTLDVTHARYETAGNGIVRVSGSVWIGDRVYTVKLEGAGPVGFQTMSLAMIRDRRYVLNAVDWSERLSQFLDREIKARTGLGRNRYDLELRLIGLNAVLGELESRPSDPAEVGVLLLVTAESQPMADEIAKLINPFLLHFPLSDNDELPTFAFPFSPAETSRGPVHEFKLNHAMTLDDPMEAFRLEVLEVGNGLPG